MQVDLYNFQNKLVYNNTVLDTPLENNLWLRSIHVVFHNEASEIMLCQNTDSNELFPGKWDIGIWGLLQSAENPMSAASRISNEKLAIYLESGKFHFLTKHSEISLQPGQKLLKTHVQTLICQVTSAQVDTEYIDYNIFKSLNWEPIARLQDRVLQQPELFALHPSHSLEESMRICYWGQILDHTQQHINMAIQNNLMLDLQTLSQRKT